MEWLYILLFIAGLVVLLKGADIITNYASRIARVLGVSEMVIGITLVAIATSLPELTVCLISAFGGIAAIPIGTIIGSNIANIGLVLAIAILTAPFLIKTKFITQGYIMLAISFLAAFMILGGMLWFEGMIIIIVIIIYLVWLVRFRKRQVSPQHKKKGAKQNKKHLLHYLFFCAIGAAGIIFGATFIVASTVEIARWLGVSEMFISLIIIAIGTSLPELATSVVAAYKRMRGISLGNIIGSNIFNLMILGISSLVVLSPVTNTLLLINIPIMLILSVLLVLFIKSGLKLKTLEGAIFLIIYVVFIALQFIQI